MAEVAQSIDLKLSEKLRDPEYRKKFFLAEASARIAEQLIALRKRRDLNQTELAKKLHTGQPAISRVERADYNNWSFSTLRNITDVLDARISVLIEPSEDILHEYDEPQPEAVNKASEDAILDSLGKNAVFEYSPPVTLPPAQDEATLIGYPGSSSNALQIFTSWPILDVTQQKVFGGIRFTPAQPVIGPGTIQTGGYIVSRQGCSPSEPAYQLLEKAAQQIVELQSKIKELQDQLESAREEDLSVRDDAQSVLVQNHAPIPQWKGW